MSTPDRACPDYPNECMHPWAHARTYAEVKATHGEHDSEVWETVSGWLFGCRTCLEHTVYGTEAEANRRKQIHDARSLPWWRAHFPAVPSPEETPR